MQGAEIVVRCLQEQGVDTVFGYPGGAVLPLFDALARRRRIRLYTCCHEQFCVHAAEGYARSSGKPGVVIATSGPGATNLVTGLADAYLDSVPLVAITGNVPLRLLGRDAFQEVDIYGVTMPITKHNLIVKTAAQLASTLRHAFRIAMEGRKGPVLVDIPQDLLEESVSYTALPVSPLARLQPSEPAVRAAAALLNGSERPVLCCGGGVIASGAADALAAFAARLGAPVATTAMGIGSFPQQNPQYLGLVGMQLNASTKQALAEADLFVGAGIRFSERMLSNLTRYAPGCKILHLDIDEAEIDKNAQAYSAVVGDLECTLRALLPLLQQKPARVYPFTESRGALFQTVCCLYPDALYTTEVGLHQLAACHGLTVNRPRQFLTSGGLGTMGFGLPAAIGAAIATGRRVINFAGDGSFRMNMQELSTAARYRLPVTQLVLNNQGLGMIRQWQRRRFDGRLVATEIPSVDTVALSEAMGVPALRAALADAGAALRDMKAISGPCLLEILLEEDESL